MTKKQTILRGMLFNQQYDRNTSLWGPEDGDPILVKDLTTLHLANIINWIMNHDNQYSDGFLEFMISEAKYRRLEAFVNGKSYVVCDINGHYMEVTP